ncbi:LuxR C-terminal-related transcriptional regulator [Herbiconiux moechotypicola]|uniref:LuxR family transcriptional regulator n=1 Tax=Herbiconiux moechotypicola TaxID=637393 RepID=A0ABN3DU82_9MICO|nr:LuxR C-terminal-related transcriptional regulator [Herbiconiux moechotypicola]MCS5731061.1 LuxR C-terminal-related transcriptional regulator [Herbiconiux moechotypicola]
MITIPSTTVTGASRRLHGRSRSFSRALAVLGATAGTRPVLLVTGPAGVGRTAFLDALVAEITRTRSVIEVRGRSELSEVPLGALAPLLAELAPHVESAADPIVAFHRAAAEPGTVIVVDDADLLDSSSACVLEQAVLSGVAPVVLSVVQREEIAGRRAAAARLDRLATTTIELAPLSSTDAFALVKDELGPAAGALAAEEMHRLSCGSTRTLMALVDAASGAGDLREQSAAWRSSWPYLSAELVASLPVDPLETDPLVEDLLRLLAVAGEVPVEQAGTAGASERATARAEAAGLVSTRRADGRVWVTPAHPLYAPVVLTSVSDLLRPGFCAAGADMLDGYPQHRVRRAVLQLAAGQRVEPALLIRLARGELAEQRYTTAITLGEHAVAGAGDDLELRATGEFVVAQSLSQIGDLEGATRRFGAAWDALGDDEVIDEEFVLALAVAEGNHLAFRTRHPERALDRAEWVLGRLQGEEHRSALAAERIKWRVMAGVGGSTELHALAARGEVETPGDLNLLIVTASLQTMNGDLELAEKAVERGLTAADRFRDELPNARDLLQLSRVLVLAFTGRLPEAKREARTELAASERSNPSARGLWRFALALIELHAGSPARAWSLVSDGRRDLVWRDIAGLLPAADALSAAVAARTGRFAIARSWLDQTASCELRDPKAQLYAALARAWVSASTGRPGQAVRTLAPAVARAADDGHRYLAALVAYEGVRIDPGIGSAVMLPHLTAASGAFPLHLAHAQAVAGRGDVLGAAKHLADASLLGPAIDAARWVAEASAADPVRESRARRLADSWTVRAGVAILPHRRPTQPTVTPLTDREWQLASGAASHRTSAELATEYGISVRTVDNHLSRIYRKLGISGRRELAAELGGLQVESPFG